MRRRLATAVLLSLGLATGLAAPAQAAPATNTITVPDDFNQERSDTRPTGSYAVEGTGLRITTTGTTSTDKVAEYVDTSTPLAQAGEPTLAYDNTSVGGVPGFQLMVDFDDDGSVDGILVGEPGAYGNDWWLSNSAKTFVKAGAPVVGGGSGSNWHGTLDQWRGAFGTARVLAFGFSLGSGVKGDGVIQSMTFAGTVYTFRAAVVLTSATQCKNGGWATSTSPVFRNQGQCVSSFARGK
jgi:hypothetical protein